VYKLENEQLVKQFSEEEDQNAVFQMEHNKALGPDGFSAEFYQSCWDIIKKDLMALFTYFHQGTLPIHRLNFGTIILLPKSKEAIAIQQGIPISLLNVSFKIFTKVATNRIIEVPTKVISPTQTAFLLGRNVLEGDIIMHEIIHEMHRKKQNGAILKIDFEKAYDKINWGFVQQTLRMKGFSPTWCRWIATFLEGGHVGIKISDQVGPNFKTKMGVRQGDLLSPILFNIVVDMLAILINIAKNDGQIARVIPNLVEDGLSTLQYVDDTTLFMDHNFDQPRNLKLILTVFEKSSGLKINFHKCEIFYFGEAKDHGLHYEQLFGCKKDTYPFRYLGIPMHYIKVGK
jgi:hypothetical protein